jgi:hemerythrin
MSLLDWSDRLDIGVDAMNREHQQLLRIMNMLF